MNGRHKYEKVLKLLGENTREGSAGFSIRKAF